MRSRQGLGRKIVLGVGRALRLGLATTLAVLAVTRLAAAPAGDAVSERTVAPRGSVIAVDLAYLEVAQLVPPIRRERPATRPDDAASQQPPDAATDQGNATGIIGRIQDWLSRANSEFQGTVVKDLSISPAGTAEAERNERERKAAAEAEAKAKQDEQAERDRAAARKRAEDLAREAAEAPTPPVPTPPSPTPPNTTPAAPSPSSADLADEMRRQSEKLTAEAKRLEEERKAAAARAEADKAAAARAEAEMAAAKKAAEEQAERRRADEASRRAEASAAAKAQTPPPSPPAEVSAAQDVRVRNRTIKLSVEPIWRAHVVARPAARNRSAERASPAVRRGPAVARWVHRAGCRAAGRRIKPPGVYTVAGGDNLWRISRRHYSIGRAYRKIWRANAKNIRNPDLIYPCQRLYLPRRRG